MNLLHELKELILNMETKGDQLVKYTLTYHIEGKKPKAYITYTKFRKDIKEYKKGSKKGGNCIEV